MKNLDRLALPLFIVILTTLEGLRLFGIIGPVWTLTCDDKPCGRLDGFASAIDIPPTDAGMHRFSARRSGRNFLELSLRYSFQRPQPQANHVADVDWALSREVVGRNYSNISVFQHETHPFAVELTGGNPPRFRLLLGSAVPRGGVSVRLIGPVRPIAGQAP